jgi:hypothetical protein
MALKVKEEPRMKWKWLCDFLFLFVVFIWLLKWIVAESKD